MVYNVGHSSKFYSIIRDYKLYSEKTVYTGVTCWHFSRFPQAGWRRGAFSCSRTAGIVCELRHFFFIENAFGFPPQLPPFPLALTIDYCWPPQHSSCHPNLPVGPLWYGSAVLQRLPDLLLPASLSSVQRVTSSASSHGVHGLVEVHMGTQSG